MNIEGLLLNECARRDAYRGLADCYYLPGADLAGRLQELEPQLARLSSEALSHALLMRSELQEPKARETLAIDFARLFVGPYRLLAPPYGSVYLDDARRVMGDSTVDARDRYGKVGLDLSESFKDAPDHIAVELEFMYYLICKEIEAIGTGAADEAADQVLRQRSFLAAHLGVWASHFTGQLESEAKTGFYRHLAVATRAFVAEDLDYLTSLEVYQPA